MFTRTIHVRGQRATDSAQDHSPLLLTVGSLSADDLAILDYVERLTKRPEDVSRECVDKLKHLGLSDQEITDIVLVVACFAFMNRLADGLGVILDPARYEFAEKYFGSESLSRHLSWGKKNAKNLDT